MGTVNYIIDNRDTHRVIMSYNILENHIRLRNKNQVVHLTRKQIFKNDHSHNLSS